MTFQCDVSEAPNGSGRGRFPEFDGQRGGIWAASALHLLHVPCACSSTAGIIRNVTLMGISGFSRGRRVKLQTEHVWKNNGSVQQVLFTSCAQKGTVCQIFISTGLVRKSRAADVAELHLSLPGSAKGWWIKRELCSDCVYSELKCYLSCFCSGDFVSLN